MPPAAPSLLTEISEVFSSLQGEGPYLGARQFFVRFGRCNMHCHYCDETPKMQPGGYREWSLDGLLARLGELERREGRPHSISLTGGEPLLYASFLKHLLAALKRGRQKTYLETNGTLPKALKPLIALCDIVAMDLKPPSSSGDRSFWKAHETFLEIASASEVFVKVVVTDGLTADDLDACLRMVRRVNPRAPFILQPVSDAFGPESKSLERIRREFLPAASEALEDVRVIPQMHKIWGVP